MELRTIHDVTSCLQAGETLAEIEVTRAPMPGIYFLCQDENVLYVGKSVHVAVRIASHIDRPDFEWAKAFWIRYPADQLDHYERRWIDELQPPFNLDSETLKRRGIVRTPYASDGSRLRSGIEVVTREEHKLRKALKADERRQDAQLHVELDQEAARERAYWNEYWRNYRKNS